MHRSQHCLVDHEPWLGCDVEDVRQYTAIRHDLNPRGLVSRQRRLVVDRGDGVLVTDRVALDGVGTLDRARRRGPSQQAVPALWDAKDVRERGADGMDLGDDLLVLEIWVRGYKTAYGMSLCPLLSAKTTVTATLCHLISDKRTPLCLWCLELHPESRC